MKVAIEENTFASLPHIFGASGKTFEYVFCVGSILIWREKFPIFKFCCNGLQKALSMLSTILKSPLLKIATVIALF